MVLQGSREYLEVRTSSGVTIQARIKLESIKEVHQRIVTFRVRVKVRVRVRVSVRVSVKVKVKEIHEHTRRCKIQRGRCTCALYCSQYP